MLLHLLSMHCLQTSGDPNCLHIASIAVKGGENYTVVVSDEDSFDAVLPIRTVKYIYVSAPAKDAVLKRLFLSYFPSYVMYSSVQQVCACSKLWDLYSVWAALIWSARSVGRLISTKS